MTHQEKVTTAVHRIFKDAVIGSVEKFSKGLANSVYKVEISNPDKILAVKFFPKKIEARVEKSALISNYLGENNIPSAQTYEIVKDEEGWAVMDCLPGNVASEAWETATTEDQHKILVNSGAMLKRIHDLKIPPFWVHQKHEIASQEEWIEWNKLRIQKYLAAAEVNLEKELVDFLKVKFSRLQELCDVHPDFHFVPLHWDYHFSNINVDQNGKISGLFDFDNAMKGHDMADLGQTVYWFIMQQKISDIETFEYLLTGYGKLSEIDREFIYLHFLLFLAGVMRSTWPKEDLKWLNDQHVGILKRCIQGEYSL